jgi:hypothetical protein
MSWNPTSCVDPLPAGAQFLGFCNACGGLRKHKRMCPVEKRNAISLEDAIKAWSAP